MSLYNSIAEALSKQGLSNAVGVGIDVLTRGAGNAIGGIFGGGQFGDAMAHIGTGMARNAGVGAINRAIGPNGQRIANTASGAIGDIMRGDIGRAGLRILDSGLLRDFLPGMDGVAAQARYFGTPTPVFGGLTPFEAQQIYFEMRDNQFCKKNLWLIEVSSSLFGDVSHRFNLFATELEYGQFTITGEKRKIGGASVDIVNSSEPVELRLTTLDDQDGCIKTWFAAHCAAAVNKDGTVGVPSTYVVRIKVVHGFITQGSNWGGYEDIGYFRPGSINMSLSRKEDNLQELELNFVQIDTFI
ncbi:MAG: hypothetical protein WC856_02320 [Methylococcaceae bacterium]|jgi:hypothetical protein